MMEPAVANEWIAVIANSDFRKSVTEYLRFFHCADAAIADQDANVGAIVNLATTDDRIAPVNDMNARACHSENVAVLH